LAGVGASFVDLEGRADVEVLRTFLSDVLRMTGISRLRVRARLVTAWTAFALVKMMQSKEFS
jgi:hypothetical protein